MWNHCCIFPSFEPVACGVKEELLCGAQMLALVVCLWGARGGTERLSPCTLPGSERSI